jgi:phenylacetaldehyde dehydrogenase
MRAAGAAGSLPGQQDLINGERCKVPLTGVVLAHPDTGEQITRSGCSAPAAVDRAITAAAQLHASSEWASAPAEHRLAFLADLAGRLAGLDDEIAVADAIDSGVPITISRMFAAALPDVVRGAIEHSWQLEWRRQLPSPGRTVELLRLPWGPAAVLAPFNAPAFTAVKKTAYALAAGCPVLLKPSPHAPHAANLLAGAIQETTRAHDAPQALFQLVHGDAANGTLLASDPRVRCLTFTGSRAAGRAVAQAAASDLKALQLECGSNNPAVVLADADIEATAKALVAGFTKLNGQWCESPGSVCVTAELHDQLLEALLTQLATLACGASMEPDVTFGPQANKTQRDTVLAAATWLNERGASLHTATTPAGINGYYIPPMIITGASPSDTADEIFGPVLTLHPVPDSTNALRLANTRIGGLAAYVFTTDLAAGLWHGEQLVAGEVKINGTSLLDMHPQSAQSFWAGSGIGGHGNADLLSFFLGSRIVGTDPPDATL